MHIVMRIGAWLFCAGILFWVAVAGAVFGLTASVWVAMEMS